MSKTIECPAIGVIGAGAWGTALANVAARAGRGVALWARDAGNAAVMKETGFNEARLPGVQLDPRVAPTSDLAEAARAPIVVVAVPAQALRSVMKDVAQLLKPVTPVVITAKGIERATGRFMTEVAEEACPQGVSAILSGPSFAADVMRGLPTAVTLATRDPHLGQVLAGMLSAPTFRIYHSTDVRGVEIGGAAKNVLAIASGIAAGRELGASAGAAIVARGFAELSRFGRIFGAKPETLMGLSGLGDLILTCAGLQSRNFAFGFAIGRGGLEKTRGLPLAEGAATAEILADLARARDVELPIVGAVSDILAGRASIEAAIETLLSRPLRAE